MDEKKNTKKQSKDFATPKALLHDSKILVDKVKFYFIDLLSVRKGTDIKGTIEGIKRDMVFKGHTVWILVASIFIASIGLNINSPAVVIGAMLISPLMGPILAIGLAVGTNDWVTLTRALKNFGIAILISLLSSTLYFWISPLSDVSSELLARTKPTVLDVLIGTFGGFAGIIAGSRYEKSNVVPGVAIATALMPPLCTAGYGLATAQYNYFFGAFYLFFLNSVFISLATFLMVRYFRFPVKHLMNQITERKFKRYIIVFVIIVILPSTKLFWDVIQESRFSAYANQFLQENTQFDGSEVINSRSTFNDTLSSIDIYMIGDEISQYKIDSLSRLLPEFGLVADDTWMAKLFSVTLNTKFVVHQAKDNTEALSNRINDLSMNLSKELRTGIIEELYEKNEAILKTKDERIIFLENELFRYKKDSLPLRTLQREIAIQYPELDKFALANSFELPNDSIIDTIPTILVKWDRKFSSYNQKKNNEKLKNWLKIRLELDTIRIIKYN
ncbi:MAG: DUF389 domain-containing protein [Bacteroidales bacterium]|nr:DUF389 domain-containing protein [Bacteroidales bacterium]